MARVAVIGAGVMGLAAAYHAARAGHDVRVIEAGQEPGGMAAHFDFGGVSIERFYHFICKNDHHTFDLLDQLGICDQLRWVDTSMGHFHQGRLHGWGDPLSLLRFPGLGLWSKFRYGWQMWRSIKRSNWHPLDDISAREWLINGSGQAAFDTLWEPLLRLKFWEHADELSAAWLWCRIKRLGLSRKSMFQETLGYIEGGSETLVKALVEAIETMGGDIRLGAPVEEIHCEAGTATAVRTASETFGCDAVIATVPTPLVADMVPALSPAARDAYRAIQNIGVVCVVLKLRQSVSPHFWVNTVDEHLSFPGFVEFSNLRPTPEPIVFVPFYMPLTHPDFQKDDGHFVDHCLAGLKRVNPALASDDLIDHRVGRLRHAQPVCPVGFRDRIPAVQTEISNLQIADTCFYYPEDRGVSESVGLGQQMAARLE